MISSLNLNLLIGGIPAQNATYNELVKLVDLTDPNAANIVYSGGSCNACVTTQRYRQSFDDVRTSVYFIPLLFQKLWHRDRREVLA
jgi:hypothetical protein